MALCWDPDSKTYEYCASHLSIYIAVGILVPLGILIIIGLVYVYARCRRNRLRRREQQTYTIPIMPIYNNDEPRQVPYNYSYPPRYTSAIEDTFGKPPSYEQTVQEISETNNNNNNLARNASAIFPLTTMPASSERRINSTRH